ncbi:alpha/beta fold hydrolase [Amycolatopsis minnesotensis]|uniref:Alpha/beta hydrolase n=1 Tax=Amycolatopsis minnesotensis TaxID=337894 RepID=A0ABN2R701_9PSEU
MTVLKVGELDVHLQWLPPSGEEGDRPPPTVVFVHGLLYDSLASYYFTVAPALAEAGIGVLMYDLRGHGRTSRPAEGYRLEHFVDDLDALLDAAGVTGPVHLVGNCFGGTIAFGHAAVRPDRVASIIAMECEPPIPRWAEHIGTGMAEAKAKLAAPEAIEWVKREHGAHVGRLTKTAAKILRVTTIAEDLPRSRTIDPSLVDVRCPVLAVFGDESGLAGQREELESGLGRCEVVVLEEQGHSVLVERPGEIVDLVLGWVRRNAAAELEEAG